MATIDYKEKYEKAVQAAMLAKQDTESAVTIGILEEIFPELREPEDERIRKDIISYIQVANQFIHQFQKDKWIAWLEKQDEQKPIETVKWSPQEESCICQLESLVKEQWRQAERVHNSVNIKKMSELMFFLKTLNPNKKPTDKIEPKFKIGQIIKKDGFNTGFTIAKIEDSFYYNDEGDYFPFTDQDNWELVEQNPAENKGMNLVEEDMTPFQKKVFCIIDTTIEEEQGLKQVCDELLRLAHDEIMQKPSWSEGDENLFRCAIDAVKQESKVRADGCLDEEVGEMVINWLKSLKNRVQPKQEWTDEDINMIDWLIRCCEKEHEELCNDRYGHQDIVSDLKRDCRKKWDWLESLKSRLSKDKE